MSGRIRAGLSGCAVAKLSNVTALMWRAPLGGLRLKKPGWVA